MIAIRRELRGLVSISIFQGKDKKNSKFDIFLGFLHRFWHQFPSHFHNKIFWFWKFASFSFAKLFFSLGAKIPFLWEMAILLFTKEDATNSRCIPFCVPKNSCKKGIIGVDTCNYSLIVVWWIFLVHLLDHNTKNDGNLWRWSFHSWAGTTTMDH